MELVDMLVLETSGFKNAVRVQILPSSRYKKVFDEKKCYILI